MYQHSAICLNAGTATHFVVQFLVDECISSVAAKRILNLPPSSISVGDKRTVRWTDSNYVAMTEGGLYMYSPRTMALQYIELVQCPIRS